MMTTVSLAQPLGQLCVELMTTFAARQALKLGDLRINNESAVDRYMLDYLWRIVIGVGAFPALLAIILRLNIPESPMFTLDVLDDIRGAAAAVAEVHGKPRKRLEVKVPRTWQGSQSDELTDGQNETMAKSTSSLAGFYNFIWVDGNWRYLAGTSVCWLLFDFAFYGLGLSDLRTQLGAFWMSNQPGDIDIAQWSPVNSNQTELPAISFLRQQASSRVDIPIVGTLVGCFLVYFSVTHLARRKIQLFGFLGLFAALLFLGVQFTHFSNVSQSPLIIFLFCLCQVFFNFGQ
jgi:PHS family inorganic phosphate transporter-like MFS transporter